MSGYQIEQCVPRGESYGHPELEEAPEYSEDYDWLDLGTYNSLWEAEKAAEMHWGAMLRDATPAEIVEADGHGGVEYGLGTYVIHRV